MKEPLATADLKWDLPSIQCSFVRLGLGVHPVQNCDFGSGGAVPQQLGDGLSHCVGLGGLVIMLGERRLRTWRLGAGGRFCQSGGRCGRR